MTPQEHWEEESAFIQEKNEETLRFITGWTNFKVEHNEHLSKQKLTRWNVAMAMISLRMVENLDGVRILTLNNRPPAAYVISRTVYEAYLNLLFIGFHSGPIPKDWLRGHKEREEKQRHLAPNKRQLARRFLAFAAHAELENLDRHKSEDDWSEILQRQNASPELIAKIDELTARRGKRARTAYGFSLTNNSWSPFRGMYNQREHLWPDRTKGIPKFPLGLALEPKTWLDAYYYLYRVAGHYVHSSSATHGRMGRPYYFKAASVVDDLPYPDCCPLDLSLNIAIHGTGVYADALGILPLWNHHMREMKLG